MTPIETIQAAFPLSDYPYYWPHAIFGAVAGVVCLGISSLLFSLILPLSQIAGERIPAKGPHANLWKKSVPILTAILWSQGTIWLVILAGTAMAADAREYYYKEITQGFAAILDGSTRIRKIEATPGTQLITLHRYTVEGSFEALPIEKEIPPLQIPRQVLDTINHRVFAPQGVSIPTPTKHES